MITHDLKESFELGSRLLVFDKLRHDPQAPEAYGAGVTLQATVTGTSPSGQVTFYDGTTVVGSAPLNGSGQASFTTTALRTRWDEARQAAAIEGFRFHDLRHTAATRILRATQNLATTAKVLSHRNLKTTLRYAHVLDDDVRRAQDAAMSPIQDEIWTNSNTKIASKKVRRRVGSTLSKPIQRDR
jgi:hypothetical protein